jgi:hypothetical protein
MRELAVERRVCDYCGAPAEIPYEPCDAGVVAARGACVVLRNDAARINAPRERSGLAYAAGFTGLAYLFRYSFAPLVTAHAAGSSLAFGLFLLWSLSAPAAVLLAYAAGASLDRSREKSGTLPALLGLLIGLFGSVTLLFEADRLLLAAFYALR